MRVSYSYGFSADIGGGPYDRRETLAAVESNTWRALVSIDNPGTPPDPNIPRYGSLSDALQDWAASGQNGLIQIGDNGIYELGKDTLKWCAGEPGTEDRPKEFATKEGTKGMLVNFKKEKP